MRAVVLAGVLAIAVAACGKSQEQKAAEQAAEDLKKAAEAITQAQKQGADPTKGVADMAKALGSMASVASGGDGKLAEPVTFQVLQETLPQVSGWDMGKPRGQRMTMPVPFSQTEAQYRMGESRVEVTVVDSGFSGMLISPLTMMMATGYSRETSDGYEKATTLRGNPAVEKWNSETKRGEIDVLVGKRFIVSLDGRRIDGVKTLHDFAAKIDFGKIASLK